MLTVWDVTCQIKKNRGASSENRMESDNCMRTNRDRAMLAALSGPSQALRRLAVGCCALLIPQAFVLTIFRCVLPGPRHRGQQKVFGAQARAAIHA